MPNAAKKPQHKDKKSDKKEEIPPDVFDEEAGTKILIAETDKEASFQSIDKPIEDKPKKESSEEAEEKENKKKEKSSDEPLVIEKESQNEDSKTEQEVDEDRDVGEVSFYEKVLGEKPPEKPDSSDSELEEEKEGLNRSLFFLGGVVFVLTIIIAGAIGFIFISSTQQGSRVAKEAEISPVLTETPSPTAAQINKEEFTFEVLNGSGEGGKAGRTADAIEALGYTADEVSNADSSDYTGLEVGFSSDISDAEKKIILDDLKKEFLEASENEDLEPEGTDILVIVGK